MKVAILSLLMVFSTIVVAEEAKQEEQAWVGASTKVSEESKASKHNPWAAVADLEMTQTRHYGSQDSDTIVNRVHEDGWYENH